MGALEGPIFCPTIRSKQGSMCTFLVTFRSGFWGSQDDCRGQVKLLPPRRQPRMLRTKMYSFSSSNINSRLRNKFNENDEDYVNSTVTKAVEAKRIAKGFFIKMQDGSHFRCVHNNPEAQVGCMLDFSPRPAFVLRMEDESKLLLIPIIVCELQSVLLMSTDSTHDVPLLRSPYSPLCECLTPVIEKMGYFAKLVRVTEGADGTYFAQLYIALVGCESHVVCIDLHPSLAIDFAVGAKVPIQVNKHLAFRAGMEIVFDSRLNNGWKTHILEIQEKIKQWVEKLWVFSGTMTVGAIESFLADMLKELVVGLLFKKKPPPYCEDCILLQRSLVTNWRN